MSDDIFDLFKKPKHHGKHEHDSGYHDSGSGYHDSAGHHDDHYYQTTERYGGHAAAGYRSHDMAQQLLSQVLNNPKILIVVAIVALVVLILGVLLLVALLPTVMTVLGGVSKMGLKGIIESIWLGTGK